MLQNAQCGVKKRSRIMTMSETKSRTRICQSSTLLSISKQELDTWSELLNTTSSHSFRGPWQRIYELFQQPSWGLDCSMCDFICECARSPFDKIALTIHVWNPLICSHVRLLYALIHCVVQVLKKCIRWSTEVLASRAFVTLVFYCSRHSSQLRDCFR